MIFDNPYIKDAHLAFVVDHYGRTVPVLVIETTVDIPETMDEIKDHPTLELIEMLAELQSFATYDDRAEFRQVRVISPHMIHPDAGHA
ncbi:hypothetical protein [Micavibrio aeruginosavorus]|uniref:Uncharacterized protein n=1 Tax=Micavibrio aeruginosavorus (strain ARL-13) TaxID=856793 RepID=G2KNH7_MICAA|nr:hypothetical protein [Micavibrio aeruginosavorus]AEP09825.1 hypothetical protein MICA_1507 [Micavibrio aeruginosavorus ARL-13]